MSSDKPTTMPGTSLSHGSHLEYSYRLPNAPRITVPPPSIESPPLNLQLDNRCITGDESNINISFLQDINLNHSLETDTIVEWLYEKRRQAQLILPWLYVGPLAAAKDREFLRRQGITMVLAIRASVNSMNGILRTAKEVCHEAAAIEAINYFELISKFPDATRMINQHLASLWAHTSASGNPQVGKVLVFCESGNEKSAAVVAAYMMSMLHDFDHLKAMQVCQTQRFCVNFDDGAKSCLRSYWDILCARRSVFQPRNDSVNTGPAENNGFKPALFTPPPQHVFPATQPLPPRAKRTFEQAAEDDDEDTIMSDSVEPADGLRFTGRDITPFKDD